MARNMSMESYNYTGNGNNAADPYSWTLPGTGYRPRNADQMRDIEGYKERYQNRERYQNKALSLFQWEGLPDTIPQRFLEWALMSEGRVAIVKDKDYGLLALPYDDLSENYNRNVYGESLTLRAIGANGYSEEFTPYIEGSILDGIDAVRGYDNYKRLPLFGVIETANERISDAMMSADVLAKKLKNPFIFSTSKDDQAALENMLTAMMRNEQAIFVSDRLDVENKFADNVVSNSVDTSSLKILEDHIEWLEGRLEKTMGIENNPVSDKESGVNESEINKNDFSTNLELDIRLQCRQTLAEQMNLVFGTNVSVRLRSGVSEVFEEEYEEEYEERKEVEEDVDKRTSED